MSDSDEEPLPFKTDPIDVPPNGCPEEDLVAWVEGMKEFSRRLSPADFKLYDRVRRRKNTRTNRNKKMQTKEGRDHFAAVSKVSITTVFYYTFQTSYPVLYLLT